MKLSEQIAKATKLLAEHGDLDILDDLMYPIDFMTMEESDGEYPEEWDLPKGTKFVRLTSAK